MRTRKILRQRGFSQRVKNAAIKAYLKERRESIRQAKDNLKALEETRQSSLEVSS